MIRGRMPHSAVWRRWAALCLWLVLIVLPGAAHAQAERTTGDWQQFVLDNDVWRVLGTYRVEKF